MKFRNFFYPSLIIIQFLLLSLYYNDIQAQVKNSALAKKETPQIELTPFMQWDKYPAFTYAINPVNSNKVRIRGTSWGMDAFYKFSLHPKLSLKVGLGYYRYSFDEINQVNSLFGYSNERIVEGYSPPGGITPSLIYLTDKYWYNTISLDLGVERRLDLAGSLELNIGAFVKNYLAFSQVYHITYPYPDGMNYKRNRIRYFGFSAGISGSILKTFKRMAIGPVVQLPVYNYWKQDNFFPQEENNNGRDKWLKGVGMGICFAYYLK